GRRPVAASLVVPMTKAPGQCGSGALWGRWAGQVLRQWAARVMRVRVQLGMVDHPLVINIQVGGAVALHAQRHTLAKSAEAAVPKTRAVAVAGEPEVPPGLGGIGF